MKKDHTRMEIKGGFVMGYCATCECLFIDCPKCSASSCNSESCDFCRKEIDAFNEDNNTWIKSNILFWGTIRFNHKHFLIDGLLR